MRGTYNGDLDLGKTLLRKVGQAVHRFKMIRDGDRVAVALSGGKDSLTLLEALIMLQKRAPVDFSVCAFTVEQGLLELWSGARLLKTAPVSKEMILNFIAEFVLGLPKSY